MLIVDVANAKLMEIRCEIFTSKEGFCRMVWTTENLNSMSRRKLLHHK